MPAPLAERGARIMAVIGICSGGQGDDVVGITPPPFIQISTFSPLACVASYTASTKCMRRSISSWQAEHAMVAIRSGGFGTGAAQSSQPDMCPVQTFQGCHYIRQGFLPGIPDHALLFSNQP